MVDRESTVCFFEAGSEEGPGIYEESETDHPNQAQNKALLSEGDPEQTDSVTDRRHADLQTGWPEKSEASSQGENSLEGTDEDEDTEPLASRRN